MRVAWVQVNISRRIIFILGLITSSHVSVNVSLCPAGTYLFGTVCRSCVAGSFSNSTNSAECTLCPNVFNFI